MVERGWGKVGVLYSADFLGVKAGPAPCPTPLLNREGNGGPGCEAAHRLQPRTLGVLCA